MHTISYRCHLRSTRSASLLKEAVVQHALRHWETAARYGPCVQAQIQEMLPTSVQRVLAASRVTAAVTLLADAQLGRERRSTAERCLLKVIEISRAPGIWPRRHAVAPLGVEKNPIIAAGEDDKNNDGKCACGVPRWLHVACNSFASSQLSSSQTPATSTHRIPAQSNAPVARSVSSHSVSLNAFSSVDIACSSRVAVARHRPCPVSSVVTVFTFTFAFKLRFALWRS